jgi:hypothetical protein
LSQVLLIHKKDVEAYTKNLYDPNQLVLSEDMLQLREYSKWNNQFKQQKAEQLFIQEHPFNEDYDSEDDCFNPFYAATNNNEDEDYPEPESEPEDEEESGDEKESENEDEDEEGVVNLNDEDDPDSLEHEG